MCHRNHCVLASWHRDPRLFLFSHHNIKIFQSFMLFVVNHNMAIPHQYVFFCDILSWLSHQIRWKIQHVICVFGVKQKQWKRITLRIMLSDWCGFMRAMNTTDSIPIHAWPNDIQHFDYEGGLHTCWVRAIHIMIDDTAFRKLSLGDSVQYCAKRNEGCFQR